MVLLSGGNLLVTKSAKVSARDLPGQLTLKTRKSVPVPLYSDEQPADERDEQTKRATYRQKLEEKERRNEVKKARYAGY